MKKHALVVDDDTFLVRTLADILKLRGWEVTIAHTGTQAVNAAARESFDVVLMDIRMPEMDGVSAFKAMKKVKPDVRVVLMTAYASDELLNEAHNEGALRVLSKPVDMRALMTLLDAQAAERPVLLIDDDASFLKTLSDVLKLRGYRAVVASSVDEAARLIETERPAAVLLHMHLAHRSVHDSVRAIRELNPSVSLVLYSGRDDAEDELDKSVPPEWIKAYLKKPFAIEELAGVLSGDDRG
jgi:two-component system response regulator HydG